MSTSARAQELAEQLLGLEATRTPLPATAPSRHFGSGVRDVVRENRTAIMIGGGVVAAVLLFWGFKKMQEKKNEGNTA